MNKTVSTSVLSTIPFVDSHTEGEPTRVLLGGAPLIRDASPAEQREALRQQDWFRRSVMLEPRGWDAMVGAVLLKPNEPECAAGVVFVNNTGYLGMCGHGLIGLAVTLRYLGSIDLGRHRIETPVGKVEFELESDNLVTLTNVPSYCLRRDVMLDVEGVAWGGNWFFLVKDSPTPVRSEKLGALMATADATRRALRSAGITGAEGAEIDHIEFFGPSSSPEVDSRNFVYCPGGAYDRSPCGTGTSAKLACLAARGELRPGERWVQESIVGGRFTAWYEEGSDHNIIPTIQGRAFITGQGELVRSESDPLRDGIVLVGESHL
jgi:4-hydroxyproline epimerase